MLGYYLSEKRLEHIKNKQRTTNVSALVGMLPIKRGAGTSIYNK